MKKTKAQRNKEREEARRRGEVRRKIEERLVAKTSDRSGRLFSLTEEDYGLEKDFEDYLLRSNLGKKELERRLTSQELSYVVDTWSIDELQQLWVMRESKLSSLYDCARLLAVIRARVGIDSTQRDPVSLMDQDSIQELRDTLETGMGEGLAHPALSIEQFIDNRRIAYVSQTIREGQSSFRQALISYYGMRCMVTGVKSPVVIDAAHITPYQGKSTSVVGNGLLLRQDIHRLFDGSLLSINPDTLEVNVAGSVSDNCYRELHGRKLMLGAPSVISRTALQERWHLFKG